jgi:hypothetical protein
MRRVSEAACAGAVQSLHSGGDAARNHALDALAGSWGQAETVDMVIKRWKLKDRKMVEAIFKDVSHTVAKEAPVSAASVQMLIDLARESAKVSRPVKIDEVADFSFVERARKDLASAR